MSSLLHSVRARMLRRMQYDRARTLARAVARLSRARAPGLYSTLWTDAIYGWNNERWSAEEQYLAEVVRSAERARGSVLECGSGLTTLLIGAVAARRGIRVHTLEHNPEWHARVCGAIHDFGLTSVTVHLAPLRDFGEYDWYDVSPSELPNEFVLVVCDGPPASTRGGRCGMLPRMRERLSPACSILLDDASRAAEQELMRSWARDFGASAELRMSSRGYARIKLHGA